MMDKNLTRLCRLPVISLVYGFFLLTATACNSTFDDIISVEPPDRVSTETMDDPARASLFAGSVQATFECALSSYAFASGMLTEELKYLGSFFGFVELDRRDLEPATGSWLGDCTGAGVYAPLSSTRWFADTLLKKLEGWTDAQVSDRQSLIASTATYAGYSLVLLGESMCSAALDRGPEITAAQLFQQAEARFGRAITAAQAAGTSHVLNMALVGRARARIDQGNRTGAAADARAVPRDFVALATRDAGHPTRENTIFSSVTLWARGPQIGVDTAFQGVTWQGVPDPRVPVVTTGKVSSLNIPYFDQRKYNSLAASVPIARWEEAQLIIAEVEGGQTAIDIINTLHTRAGIPPFTANASDAATIAAQVIEERRREFFLDGHRVGDIRRFQLPLIPPPGSIYHAGGVYRSSVCYPLPDVERDNNPNI